MISSEACWRFAGRNGTTFALMGVLCAVVVSGCISGHADRYGRDPSEKKRALTPPDQRQVEVARAKANSESNEEGMDTSPVSVLFINGDPITIEDVLRWIRADLERMAATLSPEEYNRELVSRVGQEIRARAENQLLFKRAMAGLGEGEKKGLEAYIDEQVREVINAEHGGRESRYEASLRERGVTMAEDRDRIRRQVVISMHIQKEIGDRVTEPTRREVESYYSQYLRAVSDSERRQMLLIDIPYGKTDATGAEFAEPVSLAIAHSKMMDAQAELGKGTPFEEVAKKHSQGINAYDGGDWGWVGAGSVRPRWGKAVEALYDLDVGEVSEVVQTDDALFLVKCVEIEKQERKTFAEMQPQLIESYKAHQYDRMTRELVAELYEKAVIRPSNPGRFLLAVVAEAPKPMGPVPQ